jgi:predicted small metal-binding protein
MAGIIQKAPIMSVYCKDIGIDCSFETHGSTKHELMLFPNTSHEARTNSRETDVTSYG